MKKKCLAAFLAAALVFESLSYSVPVYAAGEESVSADEAERETIYISDAEDLIELAENCRSDAWSLDKDVVLRNDIILSGTDFTSIPCFNGDFDGGGHKISGYGYGGDGYVTGFFRYIGESGEVHDLILSAHINAEGSKQVTGGIAGINSGVISNCSFSGRLYGRSESGGIAGVNEASGSIFDCVNESFISGYYYTGGICGKNYGMIYGCGNEGNINDSVEWVEEDDAMNGDILDDLTSGEEDNEIKLRTGVDTGGIAGFSKGVIIRSTNSGTVGYEHTGYNIGGIAGRQSGTLNTCTNNGKVYGRKDVGGIVGQMEPYIELNEDGSISDEVRLLHDMVNALLDTFDSENALVRSDLQALRSYADNAVDAGDRMMDQASSYINDNTDVANELGSRGDYVLEQLPAVTDNVGAAGDSVAEMSRKLDAANRALDLNGNMRPEDRRKADALIKEIDSLSAELKELEAKQEKRKKDLEEGAKSLSENSLSENSLSVNDLQDASASINAAVQEARDTVADLKREAEILSKLAADMSELTVLYQPYVKDAAGNANENAQGAVDDIDAAAASVDSARDGLDAILSYLNAQQDLELVKVDKEWDSNVDSIHRQLDGMSGTMSRLGEHSAGYTEEVNGQLRDINDQINRIYSLMENKVKDLAGEDRGYIYADISDSGLEDINLGKADHCTNYGLVKGDINIGGIAGSMAIDEEDPEENAAGSATISLGGHYTSQNVINNCINRGYITAKGDGAGGIAGFMKGGVINRCQAYGSVESTGGNYVGGVAGESLSIIRNCYVLCSLSGESYVGGVAGFGTTISGCYSMPIVQHYSGRCGAIAGQIAINDDTKELKLSELEDNKYVSTVLNGIDRISYRGKAEEMSYEDLLRTPGTPAEFRLLTVTFRVEDEYLGAQQIEYGEDISGISYPEIPRKEGFYGVWPDPGYDRVMGNLVLTAEYVDSVRLLESSETDEESGRKLALIDRDFDDKAALKIEKVTEPAFTVPGYEEYIIYRVSLDAADVGGLEDMNIRLLNPYGKDVRLYTNIDGEWTKPEILERGSYVQTVMKGTSAVYCLAKAPSVDLLYIICGAAGALALIIVLVLVIRRSRRRKQAKKK